MTDCFRCVDTHNYADVALVLQDTALRAEECIYGLENRIRQAVNMPTMIADELDVVAFPNFRTPIGAGFEFPTFTNAPLNLINLHTTLPPGMYQAGITLTATAAGAITANSYRRIDISVRPTLAAPTTPDNYTATYTELETSQAGGTDMTAVTTIVITGEQRLSFFLTHTNVGSNLNLTNITTWVSRISDAYTTRVVR